MRMIANFQVCMLRIASVCVCVWCMRVEIKELGVSLERKVEGAAN